MPQVRAHESRDGRELEKAKRDEITRPGFKSQDVACLGFKNGATGQAETAVLVGCGGNPCAVGTSLAVPTGEAQVPSGQGPSSRLTPNRMASRSLNKTIHNSQRVETTQMSTNR